jgi:hypothetical protein
MKYDFTRCNNLQFKAKDDGGIVREGFLKVSSRGTVYVYYSNENKIFDHFLQIDFDGYHGIFTDATKFGEWAENHDLEIVTRDPETYTDWKVGDHVFNKIFEEYYKIAAKLGDIVFLLDNDGNITISCTTQLAKYFTFILTDYELELRAEQEKKKCPFKEGDKVLVRDSDKSWRFEVFQNYKVNSRYPYECISTKFEQCVPLNEHTWQLLGTTDEYKEEDSYETK